jgi:hypothetical protein
MLSFTGEHKETRQACEVNGVNQNESRQIE